MHGVVIKGKKGQGSSTFVKLLAIAANIEDKFYLGFPEPSENNDILAYFKLDEKPIRSREPIISANSIVVLDSIPKPEKGLMKKGIVVMNTSEKKKFPTIDANAISKKHKIPSPNTVLLGTFIKNTRILKKDSVEKAIRQYFGNVLCEKNLQCFEEGYS